MSKNTRLGPPDGYVPHDMADAIAKASQILMSQHPGLVREEYRGAGLVGIDRAKLEAEEEQARNELELALKTEDYAVTPVVQILGPAGDKRAIWGHNSLSVTDEEATEKYGLVLEAGDPNRRRFVTLKDAIAACLPTHMQDQADALTALAEDKLNVGCDAEEFLAGLRRAVGTDTEAPNSGAFGAEYADEHEDREGCYCGDPQCDLYNQP